MHLPEWQRKLPVKVRPAIEVWDKKEKKEIIVTVTIISREK